MNRNKGRERTTQTSAERDMSEKTMMRNATHNALYIFARTCIDLFLCCKHPKTQGMEEFNERPKIMLLQQQNVWQ